MGNTCTSEPPPKEFVPPPPEETPEEAIKRYQRGLNKTMRQLDRERTKIDNQEKKIQMEMKKAAKKDDVDSVRLMAKDAVRTRKYSQKMYRMKVQVQGISMRLTTMKATGELGKAMGGATKVMKGMSEQMNMPEMREIFKEFEKENMKMGMTEDMMDDAVDNAMDDGNEEEETTLEVNKVMAEAGLNLNTQMGAGAHGAVGQQQQQQQAQTEAEDDAELHERLANLRK